MQSPSSGRFAFNAVDAVARAPLIVLHGKTGVTPQVPDQTRWEAMSGAAPATAMPQHVAIRVDVGGTVFRISLHTLMEGARFGGVVFQALCLQILGPTGGGSAWDQRMVPAQNPQYGVKHFVDADPISWPCWLEYLRSGEVPFVEAGPLRDRVICDSERAGLAELAEGLGQLAYWRRHELQALLVRPGGVYQGARLRGQDLSNLGFAKCSLRRADLSDCTLTDCTFDGADMVGANLQRAVMTHSSLPRADLRKACLSGARHAGADLSDAHLSNTDLSDCDLSGCNLAGATLPPWSSGLMEGVKLAGATGWVPADRNMRQANLKGGDLSGADLKRANLSDADLSGAKLIGADLSGCNLADATLPPWSSGLMEGVKLAGATGWMPADRNMRQARLKGAVLESADLQAVSLRNADLSGADLKRANRSDADLSGAKLIGVDLSGCKLAGATLPPWSSGLLEGVKVAGATGWVPADRNMRQVKLKGVDLRNADLSNCNLSGADLHSADLTAAELSGADLCGAMLAGARGGRAARVVVYSRPVNRFFSFGAATVQVQLGGGNSLMQVLKVGSPVVVALTAARALRLRSVAVVNEYYDRSQPGDGKHCAKRMEVLTGPAADGPWTSVATFTSAKTKDRQTFAAAPDSPALGGFVQVLVHDTHGDETCVRDVSLEGEAWGPAG
jgi:uncharacterized protein YjbI with pentapeptide repeats